MATNNKNFKVKNGLDVNGPIGVGSTPSYGADGQVLVSTGTSTAPAWEDVTGGLVAQNDPPANITVLWLDTDEPGVGVDGVTQIVAGTNITISPVGGTGAVTINSSGGGGGSPADDAQNILANQVFG